MRVLVVDDDADIAQMLALMVTKLGCASVSCSDPTEAIERHALGLLSGKFALVVCDYQMQPDGLRVLDEFIASGAYRVLLTGAPLDGRIQRALALGVIHELHQKPISLSDLSGVLDRARTAAR